MIPYGLLVTRSWLLKQGIEVYTLDNWVKSGKVDSIVGGVYKRSETNLTWQGIICSLQRMRYMLVPGGITALELHGMGHYLSSSSKKHIYLYGTDPLPSWINRLIENVTFIGHNDKKLFDEPFARLNDHLYKVGTNVIINNDNCTSVEMRWGVADEWPLTVSQPEQAILEILSDVPKKITFEYADLFMQGMVSLSPRRLNKLLEKCTNIKVKRLFLWFAERHNHAWLSKLAPQHLKLPGSGKRVIAEHGKLDPKYLITVPREMCGLGNYNE